MMLKKMTPKTLTLCAFGIALNIVGSDLALFLHLPLYLDTLGTMLCAALLGPILGMLVGASTALFVGLTTDVFSLYYSPIQLLIGVIVGLLFKYLRSPKNWQILSAAGVISLPGTLTSTAITYFLFNGITSSGSSMLVQLLSGFGLQKALAIFLVQLGTDYLDRLLTFYLVLLIVSALKKRQLFTV